MVCSRLVVFMQLLEIFYEIVDPLGIEELLLSEPASPDMDWSTSDLLFGSLAMVLYCR